MIFGSALNVIFSPEMASSVVNVLWLRNPVIEIRFMTVQYLAAPDTIGPRLVDVTAILLRCAALQDSGQPGELACHTALIVVM